ncbi:forkhead box protein M1 isoform 1-T1 [Synchiropus picturatus]
MRRSPRRPLILKRRKLPFQQNDPPPTKLPNLSDAPDSQDVQKPAATQTVPDGVYVMDHPTMSDTQVVVVPKDTDLQSVISFLTAMGKESGTQGPNKFILLNGSGDQDIGTICQPVADDHASTSTSSAEQQVKEELNTQQVPTPDDSLTNIQWLGKVSSCASETEPAVQQENSENQSEAIQMQKKQVGSKVNEKNATSVRPPYSYMAMIQFAINSHKQKRMTLKEIYTWIEDHFPYFREVAKPGWKNSIRHNLSLHDMFIRETSPDGKVSFWTIKPEANRCLTLDQAFKPGCDPITTPVPVSMLLLPQQQKKMIPDLRKTPIRCERKIKPLLPRTSYLVPIQIPVPSVYLPPCPSAQVAPSCPEERQNTLRGGKRVRIAPKVALGEASNWTVFPHSQETKVELEEQPVYSPDLSRTPRSLPRRQASSSRRKQCLLHSLQEEPVLICPDSTFLDSGLASDLSTFHEKKEVAADEQLSSDHEYSFKTPIKSSSQVNSSTPSKTPSGVLPEPWKVTPLSKGVQSILDFSPIRTPGGPAVTPSHDYTTFSLNSTPFKDLALFGSPRETQGSAVARESPVRFPQSSCSRELLQPAGSTQANRSVTEGLVLDTLNDSLSKILVDISFTGLEDEDLGMANISWSFLN